MKKQVLTFGCLMLLIMSVSAQRVEDPITPPSSPTTIKSNASDQLKTDLKTKTDSLKIVKKELQEAQNELGQAKENLRKTEECCEKLETYSKLEKAVLEIQETHPIIIKNMQVGGFDDMCKELDPYSSKFLTDAQRLRLKIEYISLLNEEKEIPFDIIIHYPGRFVSLFSVKPDERTNQTVKIKPGNGMVEFSECWKNTTAKNKYPTGWYKIEIWYKSFCLGQKTFEIR